MMVHANREPALKKMFLSLIVSFITLFFMFTLLQYNQLNWMNEQKKRMSQQLVGNIVDKYPQCETDAVETIFGDNDEDARKLGEETLKKYGYDENSKAYEDDMLMENFHKRTLVDAIAIACAFIIITTVIMHAFKQYIDGMNSISLSIDEMMEGRYNIMPADACEGECSRILARLHRLGRKLDLSFEKLNKEKESLKSLITDISHQLKTPLASAKLYNSLLQEDDLSADETKDFLMRSQGDINKLQWLVDSLVKLSRLEIGMIELRMERKNLKDTIVDAVNAVYLKANEKNIQIDAEGIDDFITSFDPKWTKEAIFNVIENSVKYSGAGGKIKISMIEMSTQVRIDIEDNGIGIPKKDFNNIFKRFYRGKSETVKNAEGSGVGLYLSRKILEEQGGCIMVDSTEGKGTVFSLFLQKCKAIESNMQEKGGIL